MTQLSDRRPPEKIAMRLASLSAVERSRWKDYLLLERPTGYLQSVLALSSEHSRDRRPQLTSDYLETPSPCTYFSRPHLYSRGIKIRPLGKYSRDILPGSTQPWTFNTSRGAKTPTPASYSCHRMIGQDPMTRTAPAYSFPLSPRDALTQVKGKVPGPNVYDSIQSWDFIKPHYPAFTISTKYKQHGAPASSPGPAHYYPAHSAIHRRNPSCNFPKVQRFNKAHTF